MVNNMLPLIISQLLDLLVYGVFAKVLFTKDITNNKRIYFLCIIVVIVLYSFGYSYFIDYWEESGMIIIIVYLLTISDTSWIKRVWITFSTISIITLIQAFILLFLGYDILLAETINITLSNIVTGIVVLTVAGVIMVVKVKVNTGLKLEEIPAYLYVNIILGICTSFFPLLIAFAVEKMIPFELKVLVSVISYLGLLCTAITIVLFIKNKNEKTKYFIENQLKEKLLKLQLGHYDEMVKNYESLRVFKHDINAHLRVLVNLEQNKEYEKLHAYTKEVQDVIKSYNNFYCDNVYITAIINSFYDDCKEHDTIFDIDYAVHGNININSLDLCSLLHNLLSNAVEETRKIKDNEKRVTMRMVNIGNNLVIEVINLLSDDFCEKNIQFRYTSKEDKVNHGLGLKSIHQIVETYNGDLKYFIKENQLRINIILINTVEL